MNVLPLTSEMRANFRNLYADIFWYGVLAGSTVAFVNIYATRLGANSFEISLFTAGPGIINLLFSLPAGRWLENRPLIGVTFWAALVNRLGYLAIIPLPWFLNEPGQIWAVIWLTLLMSVPGTLLSISFNAMLADVVPPDWRGDVVGRRNALLAFSMTGATLLCGLLLDRIVFPLNYQIVFGIGALGAGLSTYHLSRLRQAYNPSPLRIWRPTGDLARPGLLRFIDTFRLPAGLRFLTRSAGKPLLRLELLRGRFGLFLLSYLVFYTCQYIPLPLFPLAYVNEIRLTDGAISLGSGLFYGMMFLTSLRLGRYSARYGHRRLLLFSATAFSLYPLLLGLAHNASLYWVASLIGGGVWAFLSAALINRLMEVAPEDDRPAYMALHNLTLNLGILAGSLAAPLLNEWLGLDGAILLGAGLRFGAGLFLMLWS